MTDPTVIAVHPAPVVHVPRGGRHERIEFVAHRTPVTVRRARADAFEACDWSELSDDERPVIRDGDGFWSPVRGRRGTVSEDDFLRGLADPDDRAMAYLPMSPLHARGRSTLDAAILPPGGGNATRIASAPRGTLTDPETSRTIREDGRAAAAARLAEWLGLNIRSVDGVVHERRLPLASLGFVEAPKGGRIWVWNTDMVSRHDGGFNVTLATPESIDRLTARNERSDRSVLRGGTPEWAAAIGGALPLGHDAARVAANSCHAVRAHIDVALRDLDAMGELASPEAVELAAAREGVLRGEVLAMVDGFGHGDPAEALRIVLRGLDALWEAPRGVPDLRRREFPGAVHLAAEIRQGYLPGLASGLDPEDAASLGSLLPG